jgi:uncharacterized protein
MARTERIELRLDAETLEKLDEWQEGEGITTRSDAIRLLIHERLDERTREGFRLNKTDRLTMWMLAEIMKNQINERSDARNNEYDMKTVSLVQEAIYGGHFWALNWEMTGIMHEHRDDPRTVREVVDVLDTWSFIEEAYASFSETSRKQVADALGYRGDNPQFAGFDGNNEATHVGIARFLVEHMGRFERFKGRSFNSHHPTASCYRTMAAAFEPIRAKLIGRKLSVDEMIGLLKLS